MTSEQSGFKNYFYSVSADNIWTCEVQLPFRRCQYRPVP